MHGSVSYMAAGRGCLGHRCIHAPAHCHSSRQKRLHCKQELLSGVWASFGYCLGHCFMQLISDAALVVQVTAILVLYGFPWLLTGTILAHECMHAWLRLRGVTQLPLQTEEGLCQLMGLLWLEAQDLSTQKVRHIHGWSAGCTNGCNQALHCCGPCHLSDVLLPFCGMTHFSNPWRRDQHQVFDT